MKNKIEIKDIIGNVIFVYEKENNTIKDTVEEAVKNCANLSYAYLYKADLRGANLRGANLKSAILSDANLEGAYLSRANLSDADLSYAYIYHAGLKDADLSYADLRDADLRDANLSDTNLECAYLYKANLNGANLYKANLNGANLHNAILKDAKMPDSPMACPEKGSFIGWKKVINKCEYLVKLEIPEDAKRCSATTNKCRCSKAKVLEITDIKTNENVNKVINKNFCLLTTYEIGEMVYPNSFDNNRWHECSNGIHFFMDKQDALNY